MGAAKAGCGGKVRLTSAGLLVLGEAGRIAFRALARGGALSKGRKGGASKIGNVEDVDVTQVASPTLGERPFA